MTYDRLPTSLVPLLSLDSIIEPSKEDRNLFSIERFKSNAYYGAAHVVKLYSGLDVNQELSGIWPHGLYYSHSITKEDLSQQYFIAYSRDLFHKALKHSLKPSIFKLRPNPLIFPGPYPFSLARKLLINSRSIAIRSTSKSNIYFMPHSSLLLKVNPRPLIEYLKDFFHSTVHQGEVNVCIFWKDIVVETYKELYPLFDHVFCCGHQISRNFLFNIANLLAFHHEVISFGIGTHLIYAAESCCRITLYTDPILESLYDYSILENVKADKRSHQHAISTLNACKESRPHVQAHEQQLLKRLSNASQSNNSHSPLLSYFDNNSYDDPTYIREIENYAKSSKPIFFSLRDRLRPLSGRGTTAISPQ